jgi:hypothetical protein
MSRVAVHGAGARATCSHREAPEISTDPAVDGSDLYAFVSPDAPDTATIIANYVPLRPHAAGPGFFEFGDDVLYEIHVDANGDARPDLTYQFRFRTELRDDRTFLYNTGPIASLDSANWNRRQFYSVTRVDAHGKATVLAAKLACPPCNVGPLSTPDYAGLAREAVHRLTTGEKVFAGQRAATDRTNVHSIALQVPLPTVRGPGRGAVIGVWTSASRRQVLRMRSGDARGGEVSVGPHVEVSRLGNPLFHEPIVPMARKGRWNAPPEPAALLPEADMLRLDTVVPPSRDENPFGVLGGDPAGFPNGRRIADDIVSIALVRETFQPNAPASRVTPGSSGRYRRADLLEHFPYLGTPFGGCDDPE